MEVAQITVEDGTFQKWLIYGPRANKQFDNSVLSFLYFVRPYRALRHLKF